MAERGQGVYNLRKRMVPTRLTSSPIPPTDITMTSTGHEPATKLNDLKSKHLNGRTLTQEGSPSTNDDDDDEEEETIFDNNVDTRPLLNASSSPDSDPDPGDVEANQPIREETWFEIALQVFFPYIVAGFGTVGAGMVLDVVQHWDVFVNVSEVFILVPALLGLKGNLEMTLASRLSTQANLGNLDSKKEMWSLICGNMALVQAQAIVVGFLASMVAMIMGWIPQGKFDLYHGLLLCASSMFTAAVASFVLGAVMVGVVVVSRKVKINPDNVATPIAASLGDLVTLSLLAGGSLVLYGKHLWMAPTIIGLLVALIPLWLYISVKNKYTNVVVYSGWTPVLSAMFISSVGGLILDFTVSRYHGIAVFQPVINGVGGNLVAVHASRLTTALHLVCKPGRLPATITRGCPNPGSAFCGQSTNANAARVLLALVIPGHLIFMFTISYMKAGHTSITITFAGIYLTASLLQVIILLYLAHWMVHFVWRLGEDPDNVAIPYLTAIGDLLGTAFLALAFHLLYLIGDKDADVGE
ncbi:Solute carrier family 41 member 2 [Mizuhopecten yessoensis]|uniref:Solute carrier family 41 member 2 n=1 Tax=Mizuhopecten yessoensis TaxID=6573 RepID=A0A210PFS2_MIZYE|nr:Solute carrier family 41 member 2 [Mizuhopecten yessoensis]